MRRPRSCCASVSTGVIEGVRQLRREQDWTEAQFQQRWSEQLPDLGQGTGDRIREAALIAAYHAETGHPVVCGCAMMPSSLSG